MDVQTAWLDGKSWESGGQTWRWLPGDQTAGLMIHSRHSQCETGRLPPPHSAAPPPETHTLTTNPSLPLSLSPPPSLSLSLSLVVNVNSLLFSLVTYSAFIDADIPSLRFHFNSIQPTWILSVNSWTLLLGNWPWFALEGVSQPREDMQIQHSLCMLSCKTMAKKKPKNAHMDVPSWRSRTTSCYQEWQEH